MGTWDGLLPVEQTHVVSLCFATRRRQIQVHLVSLLWPLGAHLGTPRLHAIASPEMLTLSLASDNTMPGSDLTQSPWDYNLQEAILCTLQQDAYLQHFKSHRPSESPSWAYPSPRGIALLFADDTGFTTRGGPDAGDARSGRSFLMTRLRIATKMSFLRRLLK